MNKAQLIREALQRRYPCAEVPRGALTEIGTEFSVTRELVRQQAKRLGMATSVWRPAAVCIDCSAPVKLTAKDGRCVACRRAANIIELTCSECGIKFPRPLYYQANRAHMKGATLEYDFCSRKCWSVGLAERTRAVRAVKKWGSRTKPIRHGTNAGYARGCREECCKEAKRAYDRARYAARKAVRL